MSDKPSDQDFQNVFECVEEATGFREKSDSRDSFDKIKAYVKAQSKGISGVQLALLCAAAFIAASGHDGWGWCLFFFFLIL